MRFVPKSITRGIARQVLTTKKNSPHIFFAVGIAGVVGATAMACKATLRLNDVMDEIKEDLDEVKGLSDATKDGKSTNYTESDYQMDIGWVYGKGVAKVGRLYAPAAVVGVLSIAALTGSHVSLTRRNTALTAAVAAVTKAYEHYRTRVREEVGATRELELYHGAKDAVVKEGGEMALAKVVDPNQMSAYARFFDEYSPNWTKDAELNFLFVKSIQEHYNGKLQTRGHVFLNEVYDELGIDRSRAGSVVGWVISKDGDNFVDFGIFEARNSDFLNGTERSILLDFNVDGVIYDKI